jgi:hypothetical protein
MVESLCVALLPALEGLLLAFEARLAAVEAGQAALWQKLTALERRQENKP